MTKFQTISKTHNNPSPLPNEDRIWVEHSHIWALADGAGGTGILCGEWAEFLLKKGSHLSVRQTSFTTGHTGVFPDQHF